MTFFPVKAVKFILDIPDYEQVTLVTCGRGVGGLSKRDIKCHKVGVSKLRF